MKIRKSQESFHSNPRKSGDFITQVVKQFNQESSGNNIDAKIDKLNQEDFKMNSNEINKFDNKSTKKQFLDSQTLNKPEFSKKVEA